MKIEEINSSEFSRLFQQSDVIPYSSVSFNLLTKNKCDELKFLVFHKKKHKIGLIAGIKEGCLCSPFSAPFSIFTFSKSYVPTNLLIESLSLLDKFARDKNYTAIKFILPPCIYDENTISKLIYALYISDYSVIIDDNHIFHTQDFVKYRNDTIKKGVRYNIRIAESSGLEFKKANNLPEYRLAYDVIKQNKEIKGKPLGLSFDQLLEMKVFVGIDFFLVYHQGIPIASSVVYRYSDNIVQVIYWGDIPKYECYYPMNFLAMNIFQYYSENNFKIIDLGNSSKNSVPNFGLSNFKEIIGCTTNLKFTFIKSVI